MGNPLTPLSKLAPVVLATLMLSVTVGCSNLNLGQVDDSVDDREEMAGPGIFSDDDGEPALKWSSEEKKSTPGSERPDAAVVDEKAEFEQFKIWNELRTKGAESTEYQEFLQWLEYQEFKAGQ